jgi:hypothetical protein
MKQVDSDLPSSHDFLKETMKSVKSSSKNFVCCTKACGCHGHCGHACGQGSTKKLRPGLSESHRQRQVLRGRTQSLGSPEKVSMGR